MRIGTNPSPASFAWVRNVLWRLWSCARRVSGVPCRRAAAARPDALPHTSTRVVSHASDETRSRTVRAGVRGYSIHTADTCGALSGASGRAATAGAPSARVRSFTVCLKPVRAREAVFRAVFGVATLHYENLTISPARLWSHTRHVSSALWRPPSGLPSVGPCPAGPVRAVDAPRWGVGVRDPRLMKASAGSGGGS